MIIGNACAEPVLSCTDLAMAAECAAIGKEFPGWDITWTTTWGFRARKGDAKIGPCTSGSVLRCHLAVTEYLAGR